MIGIGFGVARPQKTLNFIRNTNMSGAAAGTPGTLPANWTGTMSGSGLSQTIVGTGIEADRTYLDLRIFGTTSGVIGVVQYFDHSSMTAVAVPAQAWTGSCFVKLVSGGFGGGVTFDLALRENDSGGTFLRQTLTDLLSITSTLTRYTRGVTTGASTAYTNLGLRLGAGSGVAIDFTIRIAQPQLAMGAP